MERILLDKAKFSRKDNVFEKEIVDIEVPELNPIMGLLSIEELNKKEEDLRQKRTELEKLKTTIQKDEDVKKTNKRIEKLQKEIKELEKEEIKVVTIKVSGIDFSSYIRARMDVNEQIQNLVDGITSASAKSEEEVESETLNALKKVKNMNPQAKFQLLLIKYGMVDPKLNWSDIVWLSTMFPMVCQRISDKISTLTAKGPTLKKNLKSI